MKMQRSVLVFSIILGLATSLSVAASIQIPDLAQEEVEFVKQISGNAEAIALHGHYIYAAIDSRLVVLDISAPANPTTVGQTGVLPGSVEDLAWADNRVYVANLANGVRIIDVSVPSAPTELGVCDTPGTAYGVTASGNYAYVADGGSGFQVCNVSTPSAPTVVGSYSDLGGGWGYGVAISGTYAYVGAWGLHVLDISNPEAPSHVGSYWPSSPEGYSRKGVSVVGDKVLVGEYRYTLPDATGGGVRILDISNPANPTVLGFYASPAGRVDGITVLNNYAYVADGEGGLRVVDVSNPAIPTEVGLYDTSGDAEKVVSVGSYIFVADKTGGLVILRHLYPAAITGHVLDGGGSPIEGVQIATSAEYNATTDTSGQYIITDVLPGDYTLTPAKTGCLFTPASRTVNVPPDATGQDFEGQCEFDVSGRVLDGSGNPFAGVQISAGAGYTDTTDTDGQYILTKLLSGTYTLMPTLVGYTFQPTTRIVSVPPDATGQNFVILPAPVSVTLSLSGTANLPANLTYTDTQGLTTTLRFPTGVVTEVTTLVLTPTLAQGSADFSFAGHAFEVEAFRGGHLISGLTFSRPVTVSICYSGQDVRVVSDENQLVLQRWMGNDWEDAANTCDPPSTYNRDLVNQVLSVPICHLSQFGLFGPTNQIYLPLIVRNY